MNSDILPIILIIWFCFGATSILVSIALTVEKEQMPGAAVKKPSIIRSFKLFYLTYKYLYRDKIKLKNSNLAKFFFVFGVISVSLPVFIIAIIIIGVEYEIFSMRDIDNFLALKY